MEENEREEVKEVASNDEVISEVTQKKKLPRGKLYLILVLLFIVVLAVGGGSFYLKKQNEQSQLDKKINEARQLVLYNPLANGDKSGELLKLLPKPGEETAIKYLRTQFKGKNIDKMISDVKKEIEVSEKEEIEKQTQLFNVTEKKINELKKNKHFPKDKNESIDSLVTLYKGFLEKKDVVGMNVGIAGLQALTGETTTFIQEKTEEQKKREAEEKAAADKKKKDKEAEEKALADAITNETYPSLGMLRGDIANGGGVIPMFLMEDGPSYNADFETDYEWKNSSVIVAIDGMPVTSAVLGENSMENALKKIKLGKKVSVEFKDGHKKEVELTLTHKAAKNNKYPDLPDPGKSTSSDIYFGVSGYNMGEKNNNKEIGLYITDLYSNGSAYDSDLQVGDIICRIEGYYIGDVSDIKRVVSNYYEGRTVTVDYIDKNGDLASTDVTLDETD